jgi:hypothetical protein
MPLSPGAGQSGRMYYAIRSRGLHCPMSSTTRLFASVCNCSSERALRTILLNKRLCLHRSLRLTPDLNLHLVSRTSTSTPRVMEGPRGAPTASSMRVPNTAEMIALMKIPRRSISPPDLLDVLLTCPDEMSRKVHRDMWDSLDRSVHLSPNLLRHMSASVLIVYL